MIAYENVSFSYGEQKVLENLNLTVEDGKCVCLFGRSGCGKTTALRLALGLEKPTEGKVMGIENPSVVFQENRLVSGLSVLKNVMLPLNEKENTRAIELLTEVGLGSVLNKKVRYLSGGMKRRVAFVRAVLYGGDCLILDEPFNGLDAENRKIVTEIIKREYLNKGNPVLLVTHILEDAELLGASVYKFTD